jgi:hypothetical protein
MMFSDCQMVVVYVDYRDQNTWNTIPVSEQKNTLNNQKLKNQTLNRKKENRTNKSGTLNW